MSHLRNSGRSSRCTHARPQAAGALALASIATFFTPTASAQSISELGSLTPGDNCQAMAVSADGSVVAGYAGVPGGNHAFRWTAAGGMQDLGDFDHNSAATSISADGSCVVGWGVVLITRPDSSQGAYARVFRWTAAGGLENIGGSSTVDPNSGIANSGIGRAVNANGSVVIGDGGGCNLTETFRWTQATGTHSIGTFPLSDPCYSNVTAYALNFDGTVAVGQADMRAYRWTLGSGMIDLGNLTSHPWRMAAAKGITADGTVIVGSWGVNAAGFITQAFRWRADLGMQNLGSLDGAGISPADTATISVSNDGSVIVGTSNTADFIPRPFLWTQATGMVNLQTYLAAMGVDLTGWSLCYATGLSADGRTIVGNACMSPNATSGFIVRLPAVLPPCVTVTTPTSVAGCPGGTAGFSVIGTGVGPITYQWRRDSIALDTMANPSAATATLTLTGTQATDAGSYDCVVTSACGTATSGAAMLTVCAADFDCDGTVDFFDYDAFVMCFEGLACPPDKTADFDQDGSVDFFDYDAFVVAFETPC
ncbi:MAG: hypothetical protein AABZ53_05355 [Planctomycetota bacterium]